MQADLTVEVTAVRVPAAAAGQQTFVWEVMA
jgi:hypothetical protein